MHRFGHLFKAVGFVFCLTSAVYLKADRVELHNGSVITGQVLSIKDDKLEVDSGYGKLLIPLKDIMSMDSEKPVWIRFKGESSFSPWKLETMNQQLQLVSPDQSQTRPANPSQFASVSPIAPDSDEWRWTGNANAYLSYQRGNTKKDTFNADGQFAVRDYMNRNILDWKFDYEEDDKAKLKDRWLLKYGYNRFLNPDWYLSGNLGWEKDTIKSLDHRTTVGVGLGHQFYDEPDLNLRMELGPSYIWEKFSNPKKEKKSAAGHWKLNYDQLLWDWVTLFHNQDIYYRFKEKSWLFQTSTGFRVQLIDLLHLIVKLDYDYDNDPQPGKKKDDSTLMFGLGANW